ncbi:MAG: RNA methyltransferase [Cyclobacteriaceae bacterium]
MISKNELKLIKSLKVKKYRVREKRFLIEGAKNVLELIKSEYAIDQILCTKEFYEINEAYLKDLETQIVSEKVLEDSGTFKTNSTCLAVARFEEYSVENIDMTKQIFALDGVSDPGNLGTIIRTLDWFGFGQLVCSLDCAEFHNPKVINSTMGSFARITVCYTDLEKFLSRCSLPAYGAEMKGLNLFDSKIVNPSIIVMGSESHGLSENVKTKLDFSVSIPRFGEAESLNVATATGVIASYLRMR